MQSFRVSAAGHKHDNKYKYKRKETNGSSSTADLPKRRLGCSVCNSELHTEVCKYPDLLSNKRIIDLFNV